MGVIGARLYAAEVGQGFLSVDPLAQEFASYSPYNYVLGNPVRLVDPDGKAPQPADPPDKVSDYIYSTITSNYETNGQRLLNREGSALSYLANTDPPTNTCAIRMCHALNESGYPIPSRSETPSDVRIENGREGDSGNFILDAVSMGNYLSDIESPTISTGAIDTQEKLDAAMESINGLGNFKGILVLTAGDRKAYEATGHVDLLYNDLAGDVSMYSVTGLFSGNDLDDYLKRNFDGKLSIKIWVIKEDDVSENNDE
ncbi:MAG: T6SS effector amidase Tae4 family protein [Bacteroidota bacterium]